MVIVPSGIRDVQEEILRIQIELEGHSFSKPASVLEQMDDRADADQVSREKDESKRGDVRLSVSSWNSDSV